MFVQPKYTFWKVILFPLKCHTVMRVIFAVIIYTSKVCLCVCVCYISDFNIGEIFGTYENLPPLCNHDFLSLALYKVLSKLMKLLKTLSVFAVPV